MPSTCNKNNNNKRCQILLEIIKTAVVNVEVYLRPASFWKRSTEWVLWTAYYEETYNKGKTRFETIKYLSFNS